MNGVTKWRTQKAFESIVKKAMATTRQSLTLFCKNVRGILMPHSLGPLLV